MLAPVAEDDDGGVSGKQEAPKQQRSLLSAPPGADLIHERHGAIAVGGNIRHGEIAGDESIDQQGGGQRDQRPKGVDSALGAHDEERLALETPDYRADQGV